MIFVRTNHPQRKISPKLTNGSDQTVKTLSLLERGVGDSTITTLSIDNFNFQNQADKRVLSDLLLGGTKFSRASYMQSKTIQSQANSLDVFVVESPGV